MRKRFVINAEVLHHGNSNQAREKTHWSAGDYLADRLKKRKLKRGDWCSILVMELEPGYGTALVSRHTDEASASAAVWDNVKWIEDSRYVGLALAHIE